MGRRPSRPSGTAPDLPVVGPTPSSNLIWLRGSLEHMPRTVAAHWSSAAHVRAACPQRDPKQRVRMLGGRRLPPPTSCLVHSSFSSSCHFVVGDVERQRSLRMLPIGRRLMLLRPVHRRCERPGVTCLIILIGRTYTAYHQTALSAPRIWTPVSQWIWRTVWRIGPARLPCAWAIDRVNL